MVYTDCGNGLYVGLSTDTKPTSPNIPAGSRCIETDTGMMWTYQLVVTTAGSVFAWTPGKFSNPTPNVIRIGVFDCGTGAAVGSWGLCGVSANTFRQSGTGAAAITQSTSTEGTALNFSTGTTNPSSAGFAQFNSFAAPNAQLYFRFRFKINTGTTTNRFWVGLSSFNAVTSFQSDTPLNTFNGLFFGYASGATNFDIIQNNSSGTQYSNLTSTTGFPTNAVDANWHTAEIYTLDNGSHFQYSLDNAAPFQLATTQLPAAGIRGTMSAIMSNNAATSYNWDCQYLWLSMSPNNK